MESSNNTTAIGSVKAWLCGLSETTQRLLLASLLENGQPQPAKAAGVRRRLRELVEARGARQLGERLTYHVLRSMCATLELDLSGPAPTKAECLERFAAFVGFKGLRFALGQLGVEDLDVLSEVLAPTRTPTSISSATDAANAGTTSTPTASYSTAGQRSRIYATVTDMTLRSWLSSMSTALATRVAFDLGKEVSEESTLTDSILYSPRKHQFVLAESETPTSPSSDEVELVLEVSAPQKRARARAKAKTEKKTTPRKKATTGKRRKSEPPARASETVSKRRRRTSCGDAVAATVVHVDAADEDEEVGGEQRASRCHPEIEELFGAIGLKPYVAACAGKGITPERLIVMTEAELNAELGMGRRDVRRISTHLHTIRGRLEKKAHQDHDQTALAGGAATPSSSPASTPRSRKLQELIAESNKWARRALHRDRREHRAIRDMLPSLREMPAAPGSLAQATPDGVGASGDTASFTSESQTPPPTQQQTQPTQSQEQPAHATQEQLTQSQEQFTQEEPRQLKKVKREREDGDTSGNGLDDGDSFFYDDSDIIDMDSCEVSLLVPDNDDDPPSEEY